MSRKHWTDVQSPALKPVWLRVVIFAACAIWALFELAGGNYFWAIIFGAAAIFLGYQFFVVWNPDGDEGDEQ